MTHVIQHRRSARLLGLALLATGLATFLLYEPGQGRTASLEIAVAAPAR